MSEATFRSMTAETVGTYEGCSASMPLTAEEVTWLEELPDAAHEPKPVLECELEPGHEGEVHWALGQTEDRLVEELCTHWWLRWGGDGLREWVRRAGCGALEKPGDEDSGCLLVAEHPGSHHWVYEPPVSDDDASDDPEDEEFGA